MKHLVPLISLCLIFSLLLPCIYADTQKNVEDTSIGILLPIAEGLGFLAILFVALGGICVGLSFLIIPIPLSLPLLFIFFAIGLVLASISFVLFVLLILAALSPKVANLLDRCISPVVDLYRREKEQADLYYKEKEQTTS